MQLSHRRPATGRSGRSKRPRAGLRGTLAVVAASILAILAVQSGDPSASASTTQGGTPTMLILDASGSMVRDAPGGGSRMEQARDAAVTFVESLADGQTLGLMVFGTSTGNTDADKPAGCRDVTTLHQLGPVDKAAMTRSIRGITESGFTPLGLAVELAAQQIGDQKANIVLVSDGVDACAPPPSCDRVQAVKKSYPNLTIHAIGFAVDADEQAQEELTCIASVGGGQYATASNAAQLASQLQWATDPSLLADTVAPGGVNNLRLGMTVDEALAAEPSLVVSDPTLEIVYAECAYATMRFVDGRLYDIYSKAGWPTADGVAIGDPISSAAAVYGTPYRTGTGAFGEFFTYAVAPGSPYAYRIYVLDGVIVKIVVCACGPGTAASGGGSGSGSGGGSSGGQAGSAPSLDVRLGGIGPLELGMTVDEALAAAPGLLVTVWVDTPEPDFIPFTPAIADADQARFGFACPLTSRPFDRSSPTPPIEVYIVDGVVGALAVGVLSNDPVNYGNGITSHSTVADIEAAFGYVSTFPTGMAGSERYVVADPTGSTVQFASWGGSLNLAHALVASPQFTMNMHPSDWAPCVAIAPRASEER